MEHNINRFICINKVNSVALSSQDLKNPKMHNDGGSSENKKPGV